MNTTVETSNCIYCNHDCAALGLNCCYDCFDKDGEQHALVTVTPATYKKIAYLLRYGTSDYSGFGFSKDGSVERWRAFGGPKLLAKRNGRTSVELLGPEMLFDDLQKRLALQIRVSLLDPKKKEEALNALAAELTP